MKFKKVFFTLLAVMGLVACSNSDGDGEVLYRIDESGVAYSPTEIYGFVKYLDNMELESVKIVSVDGSLNPLDSFEASLENDHGDYYFAVGEHDYQYPIVKVVPVFSSGKKMKMEFPQYVRLQEKNDKIELDFYEALASERIKKLALEKNYDFEKAKKQALLEFASTFNVDVDKMSWHVDLMPYIMCRHEISDSVFYSDFKEIRKAFGKKGSLESSIMVRAADAWLSTYELSFDDSAGKVVKSYSRDTVVGFGTLDFDFFERAYGITFNRETKGNLKIKNNKSAYNGRYFIYDGSWRLKSLIEDTLGLCLMDTDTLVKDKESYYRCMRQSNIWKKETNRDTLLTYIIGVCGRGNTWNKAYYVRDTLYACECTANLNCKWTDEYNGKKYTVNDAFYPRYFDANVSLQIGECLGNNLMEGVVKKLDDMYVKCTNGKWTQLKDSLSYLLGACSADNSKGEISGRYYGCLDYKEYGGSGYSWVEIPAPAYHGDSCNYQNDKRVKKYDGSYFICEIPSCKDKNGYTVVWCRDQGIWRKMDESELNPPTLNMDVCKVEQENLKKIYDGKYYVCKIERWHPIAKDSLLQIEKDGFICSDSLLHVVKKVGKTYYQCDYENQWKALDSLESVPYEFRDSLGICDTITNKTLYWSEKASAFYGCAVKDSTYRWAKVDFAYEPFTMPKSYDKKKFAGGKWIDGFYTVTVDNVVYRFDKGRLDHVDYLGKGYDAYFYNGSLFLHGERESGENLMLPSSIENKSASFDNFFAEWKTWMEDCSECSGRKLSMGDTLYVNWNGKNSYMDWEHAKEFCPDGFHVPTSEEFMQDNYIAYTYYNIVYRNDSPIVWVFDGGKKTECTFQSNFMYSDIFWTSTEKDAETQKCYEFASVFPYEEKGRRIVDCPKDLYPMAQVLCVQDK